MLDIESLTKRVNELLEQDTDASVTYAALECRLAIERACYLRLRNAHDYISQKDLRGYRPRDVVETLLSEVDGNIASSITLSMSAEPVDPAKPPSTVEDYEKLRYIELGTQSAVDHKKLSGLWHSLSNVALHTQVPISRKDPLPEYGNREIVRRKVVETLEELAKIARGNLLSPGIGPEVSFVCACGRENKRKVDRLEDGKIVRCVGPECDASYTVAIGQEGIVFTPRLIDVKCECGEPIVVPIGVAERLRRDNFLSVDCPNCTRQNKFMWRFFHQNG